MPIMVSEIDINPLEELAQLRIEREQAEAEYLATRTQLILHLHAQGKHSRQIAELIGCSHMTAYNTIVNARGDS